MIDITKDITVGFAMTGSFCTFSKIFPVVSALAERYRVIPIVSYAVAQTDTRFIKCADTISKLEKITGNEVIKSLTAAEPIGPKKLLDILVIAPCTGNTTSKLAHAIADTPVTLAFKAHLRNMRPVLIAISTNDALSQNAGNIGRLMNMKNIYFVPFSQDDSLQKPASLVADFSVLPDALDCALLGKQLQPIIL